MTYEHKKGVANMWCENQQLLKVCIDRLVRRNKLAKSTIIADEIGMTHDKFHSCISISPRTPITSSERVAIEHQIARRDLETFTEYLRSFHLLDTITVEEVV